VARTLAGGVDVVIDRTPYSATYGIERPDVAKHFNNPAYVKSGFQFVIPQLPIGQHSVTLRVIAQDKKSYYEGPTVQFTVE
jgi:hypothetical protein